MRRGGARRAALATVAALTVAALAGPTPAPAAAPAPPAAPVPPQVSARTAVVIEASTGETIYGRAGDERLPIASTTKLMTALLTLEHTRLDSQLAAPAYSASPAEVVIGLAPGERMSVHDLMLAMLLPSANDAAEDLAYNVGGGSVARFVAMMNERARRLGLAHTHYATPIGLDTPGNYSSAADLVKLADHVRERFPFFARAVALHSAVLRTGRRVRVVVNRNDLVGRIPWINGVKTGHTIDAGYVLVASGTRQGMTLLSAVLGDDSAAAADADTLVLLDAAFESYRLATPVTRGEPVAARPVQGRPAERAEVVAAAGVTQVVSRHVRLSTRVELPRQLDGPLPRHAVVGRLVVFAGRRPIARVRLLLAQALPRIASASAARFITRPSTVLSLVVLLGAAMALARRRWMRLRQARDEGAGQA